MEIISLPVKLKARRFVLRPSPTIRVLLGNTQVALIVMVDAGSKAVEGR
jgi:hypothetical protein